MLGLSGGVRRFVEVAGEEFAAAAAVVGRPS